MIKISVVIPYFNADKWIGRMLDSLLKQDLSKDEYEIIVVDDGSKDEPVILMQYVQNNSNIRYVRQENSGPGAARNSGIENAKGEFIFFCDSDDFVAEHVLGKLYNIAHDRELDMLFHNVPRVSVNETVTNSKRNFDCVDEYPSGQDFFAQPIEKFISMGVWQFIISNSFINRYNLRFPPDMIMNEDACFIIDAILVSNRTAKIDADVYYYIYNPQSSIHFSGKVLQSDKWTNNILLFIEKINVITRDCNLTKNMPIGCLNNLLWLKNHKSYIVLTEGCRYLSSKKFNKVISYLMDMDSYPKPFGKRSFRKKMILNKYFLKVLNLLYGIKRKTVK